MSSKAIKRLIRSEKIDQELLLMYNNENGNSIREYKEDVEELCGLQKMLRKKINKKSIDFLLLRNRYILLRNIFGVGGLVYIAVEYFSENEKMFELFCSMVYFFDGIKISNKGKLEFLEWLKKENKEKIG